MKVKGLIFTKMLAAGNDFIILENRFGLKGGLSDLAKRLCSRKYGIGADGLLVPEPSSKATLKMRIFNPDGSEAEMCGNGARCLVYWGASKRKVKEVRLETKAGIILARIDKDNVRIKLTPPSGISLDLNLKLNKRNLKVNFINTGVPHAVIFVEGLQELAVEELGRLIRYHPKFKPQGTNVNFVEPKTKDYIALRTYERGVEEETLSCGTGVAASALIYILKFKPEALKGSLRVETKSKEVLKVHFERRGSYFSQVWLEGKVKEVFGGRYYV